MKEGDKERKHATFQGGNGKQVNDEKGSRKSSREWSLHKLATGGHGGSLFVLVSQCLEQ